jgi:hypothetical protein
MMENIKIGLLGLITVISGYSVYQVSTVKGEMETLKEEMSAKMTMFNASVNSGVSNNSNVSTSVTQPQTNNLPSTEIKTQGPTTAIKFGEEIHDFGTVEVESENLYAFTFTNTGSEPLKITNAKGSCGCTVPKWPQESILPGQTGTIDVKFTPNAGQAGQPVEKVVTVTANTSPENTMVRIKANVIAK